MLTGRGVGGGTAHAASVERHGHCQSGVSGTVWIVGKVLSSKQDRGEAGYLSAHPGLLGDGFDSSEWRDMATEPERGTPRCSTC